MMKEVNLPDSPSGKGKWQIRLYRNPIDSILSIEIRSRKSGSVRVKIENLCPYDVKMLGKLLIEEAEEAHKEVIARGEEKLKRALRT